MCCALYGGGGTLRLGAIWPGMCRCTLLSIRMGGIGGFVGSTSNESSDGAVSSCPGKKLLPKVETILNGYFEHPYFGAEYVLKAIVYLLSVVMASSHNHNRNLMYY